jgi:hypothetical protein
LNTEPVSIKYDEFIKSCANSWLIRIDNKNHFFPFSLCSLDEESKEIICPMWMIVDKGIDAYAVV